MATNDCIHCHQRPYIASNGFSCAVCNPPSELSQMDVGDIFFEAMLGARSGTCVNCGYYPVLITNPNKPVRCC